MNAFRDNAKALRSLAVTLRNLAATEPNIARRAKMLNDANWYQLRAEDHDTRADEVDDRDSYIPFNSKTGEPI